jgi:hypothetical protein
MQCACVPEQHPESSATLRLLADHVFQRLLDTHVFTAAVLNNPEPFESDV